MLVSINFRLLLTSNIVEIFVPLFFPSEAQASPEESFSKGLFIDGCQYSAFRN